MSYRRDATDRIVERTTTGPVPITHRGTATANNGSGATTLKLTRKVGLSVGDLLIAHISVAGGSSTTVAAPAGWTLVSSANSGTAVRSLVYRRRVVAGELSSYTFTFNTSRQAAGSTMAFGGVDTATPVVSVKSETAASGATVGFPAGVTALLR